MPPYAADGITWIASHDSRGRTPEGVARDNLVAAVKRVQQRNEPLAPVRKAGTPIPVRPIGVYDHRGRFIGLAARSRVATSFPVAKALKAQGPVTPCFDSAGQLVGVVDPDDLVGLAKGESWSYDATGALNGIISVAGIIRPVAAAKPSPAPAAHAAPTLPVPGGQQSVAGGQPDATPASLAQPVAKSRTEQLIAAHAELARRERAAASFPGFDNAGILLASLGKEWSKRLVNKALAKQVVTPLDRGRRAYLALSPTQRRAFDAKWKACTIESKRAVKKALAAAPRATRPSAPRAQLQYRYNPVTGARLRV